MNNRFLALIISLVMLFSLCACSGETTDKPVAVDDMTQHVNIRWMIRCSEPEGFDEVMERANEYLNEKLNVTLNLECIESGDFDQKVQLALSSGEEVDIVWTSSWSNQFEPNVAKSAYLALDEYLELPELESLKNYYSDEIWGAASINGKIYGMPVEQVLYNQSGRSFMKEISEKYGLTDRIREMSYVDSETHGSMEDIEEIYDIIRAGEPDDYAITVDKAYKTFTDQPSTINGYKIVDGKVDVDLEKEEGLEIAIRAKRWNDKGYFPADIATLSDVSGYKSQGKVYSSYYRYLPGSEAKHRMSNTYDIIHIPTDNKFLSRTGIQTTLNAIPISCQNPVRALKLLELMHTDAYLMNLICYGIEGRDYTVDTENPKRMNRDAGGYYVPEYLVGSQFLALLSPGYEDGVWEQTKAENEAATCDPYIGFSFDSSSVESEISQCSAVNSEYSAILGYGLAEDPEAMFYEKEKKLELAGRQIIIDEIERQLGLWMEKYE